MTLTSGDIDRLESVFVTKQEFSEKIDSFREETSSKLENIVDTLSDVMKEIKDNREERTLVSHKISDHEDRIIKLESTANAS